MNLLINFDVIRSLFIVHVVRGEYHIVCLYQSNMSQYPIFCSLQHHTNNYNYRYPGKTKRHNNALIHIYKTMILLYYLWYRKM